MPTVPDTYTAITQRIIARFREIAGSTGTPI